MRPAAYQRLHENKRSTGSESFISMQSWDKCVDENLKPLMPNDEHKLYVGVDAALKNDCTAVVAVAYIDEQLVLARHRIWKPTKQAAGVQLGDILRIDYGWTEIRVSSERMMDYDASTAYSMPMPDIEPDEIKAGDNVTVVWAIE